MSNSFLDMHAATFGIHRHINENDAALRARILSQLRTPSRVNINILKLFLVLYRFNVSKEHIKNFLPIGGT